MYNDEKNLYHYTYRKDGSESTHTPEGQPSVDDQLSAFQSQNGPQQPIQEMKPVKKNRMGLKVTALALCCALLGGAVGGGVAWGVSQSSGGSTINVSGRPATTVSINTVDGKTEMTDAEVYAATVNSVVSIRTSSTSSYNFFGQAVETASAGSGFVLTSDGYIVTNYHVVKDADTVTVTMYNGDEYNALYVGGDEDYDIAVIKVEATDLQAVTLGDSSLLNVGDHVLAIGNPLGELTFSMSGGMVSSVNRTINVDGTPFNMIQTDTSINPGNSGGPLMNLYGEVVGIVSAKYSSYSDTTVEGLGFAIPIGDVQAIITDIMENGQITNKPSFGITAGTMTQQMAAQYQIDQTSGAFVYSVNKGGAGEKAGLKMGDVITKVDSTDITSMEDLTAAKKGRKAGDTVTVTYYRDGQTQTTELTFDAKTDDTGSTQQEQQPQQDSSFDSLYDYFFGRR